MIYQGQDEVRKKSRLRLDDDCTTKLLICRGSLAKAGDLLFYGKINIMQKLFIKNRKNQKIAVVVNIPEKPVGIAFVMHGLSGYKEQLSIQVAADVFYKQDLVSVIFDTTNTFGESEGDYEKATAEQYYQDLEDVISWSKSQDWYQEPFFVSGESFGGYCATRFAETYPGLVKGLFAFAPFISGKTSEEAHKRFASEEFAEWEKTGWLCKPSSSKPGLIKKLPWSHMEERYKHDLMLNVSKITAPVLLVVGEKDTSIPPYQQKVLFDAINSEKEMVIVSGAPHNFKKEDDLNTLKIILTKWIKKVI